LPDNIQNQARKTYKLFIDNPNHPSLRFRQVHPTKEIYSVRITADFRALGVRNKDEMIWFWIGSHSDYDKLLDRR